MSNLQWYKVATHDDLEEGHVRTVSAGHQPICLTYYEGNYHALNNSCPHQGVHWAKVSLMNVDM